MSWRAAWVVSGCLALAACFTDTEGGDAGTDGSEGSATTQSTSGSCPPGSAGCSCYGNGSCDPGQRCEASVNICIPDDCVDGAAGCPCGAEGCDAGLICDPATARCLPDGSTSTSTSTSSPTSTSTSTTSMPGSETADTTGASATGATSIAETGNTTVGMGTPLNVFITPGTARFGVETTQGTPRDTADELCTSQALTATMFDCSHAVALISVTPSDSLADLVVNRRLPDGPVFLDGGNTPVAKNFEEFVGLSIQGGLEAAGLREPQGGTTNEEFWTGSDTDGQAAANCDDWTNTGTTGRTGRLITDSWLSGIALTCTESNLRLLCACWDS